TIGNLRLMEQDHKEDVEAAAEWGGKALAASRKADELRGAGSVAEADKFDNLAKVALGRQLQSEQEARTAEPTIAAQSEAVGKQELAASSLDAQFEQLDSLGASAEVEARLAALKTGA